MSWEIVYFDAMIKNRTHPSRSWSEVALAEQKDVKDLGDGGDYIQGIFMIDGRNTDHSLGEKWGSIEHLFRQHGQGTGYRDATNM